MRIAIVIGSILLLAGCISVPPAITIASWVIDGA
jgi:starvation-inducible outer membrane lipoprotein